MSYFQSSDFWSQVDESHGILLDEDFSQVLSQYARMRLVPYFSFIAVRRNNTNDILTPRPSELALSVINDVFYNGELSYETRENAIKITRLYVRRLPEFEKKALFFYCSTKGETLNQLVRDEENTGREFTSNEEIVEYVGSQIRRDLATRTDEELVTLLVDELRNFENLLPFDEPGNWGPAEISNTNETFENYIGVKDHHTKFINIIESDYDYWEKVYAGLDEVEDEDEDLDEVENED